MQPEPGALTPSAAAAWLSIGRSTLDRLAASGVLRPVYVTPRRPRYRLIDLQNYLARLGATGGAEGSTARIVDLAELTAARAAAIRKRSRRG